jgi:hypothetical protein
VGQARDNRLTVDDPIPHMADSVDPAFQTQRVTLSRELSEFLIELSIAVQKHGMYPGGHPSLGAAVASLTRGAERLLEERPTLVFGVARRQLVIDGVATDPDQPVLRRLAEGLHRHHLGAVSLSRGVQPDEMGQALRALAAEVERSGPLGLAAAGTLPAWPHVRLHPLTFDRLELVSIAPEREGMTARSDGRAAELWVGLARAAMAADLSGAADAQVSTEPAVVAQAIDEHHGATAYDQVIVGYLLQIAQELKSATGGEAAALRRRTARLIAALRPETLRRLVAMGGDVAQRRAFVLDATSGMSVDAVLEILKAAADASGQTISHGLVRMLSKLAAHAELGDDQVRPLADGALREQVTRLLAGWDLADPNPDAYRKVLQQLAVGSSSLAPAHLAADDEHDPLRIVQMGLEVGEFGPAVDRAMDCVIKDGRFGAVLHLLASLPDAADRVAERVKAKLVAPASIAVLVRQEPLDLESLDRLFGMITVEGYELFLDALATSPVRSVRRKLLDRLAQTDLDVAPLIAARLQHQHWYVVRNMLVLLQRLRQLPPGFSAEPWMRHADPRIRYEAIHLQSVLPEERERALRTALEDDDLRVLRFGLMTVQAECPRSATALLVRLALRGSLAEDLRVLAIRALARTGESSARDALLHLVDGGRTLLGRPRLAPPTPICIAALRALAEGWSADRSVSEMLAIAAASADPGVRQAAGARRR